VNNLRFKKGKAKSERDSIIEQVWEEIFRRDIPKKVRLLKTLVGVYTAR
jgi:hypothetical protein